MEEVCSGKVCEKHTESDGEKQKRFKLSHDRKVEQHADYYVHYKGLNEKRRILKENRQSCRTV